MLGESGFWVETTPRRTIRSPVVALLRLSSGYQPRINRVLKGSNQGLYTCSASLVLKVVKNSKQVMGSFSTLVNRREVLRRCFDDPFDFMWSDVRKQREPN